LFLVRAQFPIFARSTRLSKTRAPGGERDCGDASCDRTDIKKSALAPCPLPWTTEKKKEDALWALFFFFSLSIG
jgi:hypothetical protein